MVKNYSHIIIVLCLNCICLFAQSQNFDNAIKSQTQIINNSYKTAYIYGDDTMQQLEGISLRAFLSWFSRVNNTKRPPIILNLNRSDRPCYVISTDGTKERIEHDKRKTDEIFYQYPMILYPQYHDCIAGKLIESKHCVIGIYSKLYQSWIEIRILALMPKISTDNRIEFSKFLCIYNYKLKIDAEAIILSNDREVEKNRGKLKLTKEEKAAKELVSDLEEEIISLVDEDGFIDEDIIESFCWRLEDMSIDEKRSEILNKKDVENEPIANFLVW